MKLDSTRSIHSLYPLALAEGEGVGTAYEYYAKRLLMARWIGKVKNVSTVLIAGLPQKYGSSLDFVLLANEFKARLIVADERPEAIQKLRESVANAQNTGELAGLDWTPTVVSSLQSMSEVHGRYDVVLSSEVIQRLPLAGRSDFIDRIGELSVLSALFAPNADNPGHTNVSGLSGLHDAELLALFGESDVEVGYLDMPPFPPGLTRTDAQREQATSGTFERVAMHLLVLYARMERLLPKAVRRRQGHIVYALRS